MDVAVGVLAVAGHVAVALQAGQRRVDLPDVERPRLAGAGLEGRLELVAVARPLAQERQQPVLDRHALTPCLLGRHTE